MTTTHRVRGIVLVLAICATSLIAPASAAAARHEPQWMRALEIRSDALNRKYHLGRYAHVHVMRAPGGFDWGAAIVGAGTAVAAMAGLGALVLTIRSPRFRSRLARTSG